MNDTKLFSRTRIFASLTQALFIVTTLFLGDVSIAKTRNKTLTAHPPAQFQAAKKMMEKVYLDHQLEFYCGCEYQKKTVKRETCGYKPLHARSKRANNIEWEHIVPADRLGETFTEWTLGHEGCPKKRKKGRECARKMNAEFRSLEANPYNLVPAIGELNEQRKNYAMDRIPSSEKNFGQCQFKISGKKVEPRDEVKGDVARTYLYMAQAYPLRLFLTESEQTTFAAWSEQDPPDQWECLRYERIKNLSTLENPIMQNICQHSNDSESKVK